MKIFYLILFIIISTFNPSLSYAKNENPSLTITTINDENFNLTEKKGKVILINFWAKWCSICLKEMTLLDEINEEFKGKNFEILGLNVERKRHKKKVTEISSKLSYQNAIFDEAVESNFEEPNSLPTIYIINKEGKINSILKDETHNFSKEHITQIIKSLL